MSNTIKAMKIDVQKQSVYEIEIENTLEAKYKAIGNGCTLLQIACQFPHTVLTTKPRDVMYVDEDILMRTESREEAYSIGAFKYAVPPTGIINPNHPIVNTIVGNAIIVGTDIEGNTTDHTQTVQSVMERIFGFIKY